MADLGDLADAIHEAVRQGRMETRWEETPKCGLPLGMNDNLRQALMALPGEQKYRPGVGQCDLVFGPNGAQTWIEVKPSWTWKKAAHPGVPNGSRRSHLLEPRRKSALFDLRNRLPQLYDREDVAAIGMLVIALDSDEIEYPLTDIAELERLGGGLRTAPWKPFDRPRWRSTEPGYSTIRVQPFLWMRRP